MARQTHHDYFGEMESPQPEKKKQYGCMELITRVVLGIGIIILIDYISAWIFKKTVPYDDITTALVPFQNNYLAFTDAFVTDEFGVSEFSYDPGPATRFFGLFIFVLVGSFVLALLLYIPKITRDLLDYYWYFVLFCLALAMIHSTFYPSTMTVFDRERKMMVIHKTEWMFFGKKTEFSFDQIDSITYEIHRSDGNDHYTDVEYSDLFAIMKDGNRVFIGESQIGEHKATEDPVIFKGSIKESKDAVAALTKLIGK